MPRRLRLGMIGGGPGAFIGAVHRIAARIDDRFELVAGVFSQDSDRSRAGAAECHVADDRVYADFADMAVRESARPDGIDAVAIVTPNHMHYAPARAFLRAGIHVICDKPLCHSMTDANTLAEDALASSALFAVTYNYTGYPLVRQARAMVEAGALGEIRVVQVEYAQDWLSTPVEQTGQKQAAWRTDPARSGEGGSVGDIGTHAFNLAEFVTDLKVESLAAELTSFGPGRVLDDNAQMLLRFQGGARGMMWTSQVAVGRENALRLRVYGTKAGLEWSQEDPNTLRFTPLGEQPRHLTRGGPGGLPAAAHATRLPGGHPEGYLEAFAQLYRDFADQIVARQAGQDPDPSCLLVPGIEAGLRGMQFITASVGSSRAGGLWTAIV